MRPPRDHIGRPVDGGLRRAPAVVRSRGICGLVSRVGRSSLPVGDDDGYVAIAGDIADPDTARPAIDAALERFGRIDTLINNAGIYIGKPFTKHTVEDFAAITAVNLTGFFHITQLAIEQMVEQRRGHVVNISTSLVDHADSKRPSALPPLGRVGKVSDVVDAILCLERAPFVTGETLHVDGGQAAGG